MIRGVAAVVAAVMICGAAPSGQSATEREFAVGTATRRFVPPGPYNWRGAATHALLTTVWYPAAPGTTMSEHSIGRPEAPLFRLGQWAEHAPLAEGRFPLIALSHGTGGSAEIMAWLARGLASRGYVVAAVNHPGNNALEPYTVEGFLVWWERARDLTSVIDMVLRDGELRPAIDRTRIGAIGFSLGGYTVFELAGGRTDPALLQKFCRSVEAEGCADPPEFPGLFARWSELEATNETFRDAARNASRSYRDSRVRAVFAIAPAIGPTFTPASLKRIAVPVAIVAGTDDLLVPPRSNAQLLARLTPRASLTLLHSVGHYTFLATCTEDGRRVQQQLCADVAGVDREEVHRRTIDNAVHFFDGSFK